MPTRAVEDLELSKEWRQIVLADLRDLKRAQGELLREITDIKTTTTTLSHFQALEERTRRLEEFRVRAVTIFVVIQTLLTAAWGGILFVFDHAR